MPTRREKDEEYPRFFVDREQNVESSVPACDAQQAALGFLLGEKQVR